MAMAFLSDIRREGGVRDADKLVVGAQEGLLVCDVHGRGDRCSSGDVGSALPTTDDVSGWPELCGRLGIGCLHHCAG